MTSVAEPPVEPRAAPTPEPEPGPPTVDRACTTCGAGMAAEQEWCLVCGNATPPRGQRAGGWRAPLLVLGTVLFLAGTASAVAYVEVSDDARQSGEQLVASNPTPPPAATPPPTPPAATPPAATREPSTPSRRRRSRPARRRPSAPAPASPSPAAQTPAAPAQPKKEREKKPSTDRGSKQGGFTVLSSARASDYDPYGDKVENPNEASLARDGDTSTSWTTADYPTGLGKAGIGIYLEARDPVALKALGVVTRTPGFDAEVYGAEDGPPDTVPATGWSLLGRATGLKRSQRIGLATGGRRMRFFLLWVTRLPDDWSRVSIAELRLLR